MDANLPPWLEPKDFSGNFVRGMNAGESLQNIAMEQERFKANQQIAVMGLQQRKSEFDKNFQLETAKMATMSELRKQQLKTQAEVAARKYQQQQQYESTVKDLMSKDPSLTYEDAAIRSSFMTGYNTQDVAAIYRQRSTDYRTDNPPPKTGPVPIDEKDVRSIWTETYKTTGSAEEANKAADAYRSKFSPESSGQETKPATERYKIVTGGGAPVADQVTPGASGPAPIPKSMQGIPAPVDIKASIPTQRAHPASDKALLQKEIEDTTQQLDDIRKSRAGQANRTYRQTYEKLAELHRQLEALP